MTRDEQLRRLERDNQSLMRLLHTAISALPEPRQGRQPGDPINWRYAGERPILRLLHDIDGDAA